MVTRIAAKKIIELATQFKAVAIIGPRQSGKTTLARACFPQKPYVSLENPEMRAFAIEDPKGFLNTYPDGAILDEVQRTPDILSWLQERLDEDNRKGVFVLTGSNNFLLIEKITQSLAGRVAYVDLLPFSLEELLPLAHTPEDLNEVLFKGSYPPIIADNIPPQNWFPAYVRTYVERDVRQIKNLGNLLLFEKLLSLCAGRVGQLLNYSNLANELGVDIKTVQSWLGILQASYIIHLLPPYFKNFSKRIIKSPKLYFYDTGLACYLLQIKSPESLINNPIRGALFENFIINEMLKNRFNRAERSNLYFWRDNPGNEIDIIVDNGTEIIPIEVKAGQTINRSFFKNLTYWLKISGVQNNGIIYYGGSEIQKRSNNIEVRGWKDVGREVG